MAQSIAAAYPKGHWFSAKTLARKENLHDILKRKAAMAGVIDMSAKAWRFRSVTR
jgi:hypothetical protein